MNVFSLAPYFVRTLGQTSHINRLYQLIAPALPHFTALHKEAAPEHIVKGCALLAPDWTEIDTLLRTILQAVLHETEPWTVQRYQLFLRDRGYYQGVIDGDPGVLTRDAVRKYQNATLELIADGWVGPATMERMVVDGA